MAEVEKKNKSLFKDWVNQKILLHGDEDFKEALEKYNTNYLPSLLKQEWFKYLKVKANKNEIKKISWLDRLNQSFKKNNITSIDSEVYMKIEFEEIIEKKEKEFEILKKKIIDDYENKIFVLKEISNKSISKFQEKKNKENKEYQEKIDFLETEVENLKEEITNKETVNIFVNDGYKKEIDGYILQISEFDKLKLKIKDLDLAIHAFYGIKYIEKKINYIELINNSKDLISSNLKRLKNYEAEIDNYKIQIEEFNKLKLKLKNLDYELISEDPPTEDEFKECNEENCFMILLFFLHDLHNVMILLQPQLMYSLMGKLHKVFFQSCFFHL